MGRLLSLQDCSFPRADLLDMKIIFFLLQHPATVKPWDLGSGVVLYVFLSWAYSESTQTKVPGSWLAVSEKLSWFRLIMQQKEAGQKARDYPIPFMN